MRLLLDECVPRGIKRVFVAQGHECQTAVEAGFSGKENGELLTAAESYFDVLITIDKNIRFQQNMAGRQIAIVIVRATSNDIDDIQPHIPRALTVLDSIKPGQIIEVGA